MNTYTVFVTMIKSALAIKDYGVALFIDGEPVKMSANDGRLKGKDGRFGIKFFIDPRTEDFMNGDYTLNPYIELQEDEFVYGENIKFNINEDHTSSDPTIKFAKHDEINGDTHINVYRLFK